MWCESIGYLLWYLRWGHELKYESDWITCLLFNSSSSPARPCYITHKVEHKRFLKLTLQCIKQAYTLRACTCAACSNKVVLRKWSRNFWLFEWFQQHQWRLNLLLRRQKRNRTQNEKQNKQNLWQDLQMKRKVSEVRVRCLFCDIRTACIVWRWTSTTSFMGQREKPWPTSTVGDWPSVWAIRETCWAVAFTPPRAPRKPTSTRVRQRNLRIETSVRLTDMFILKTKT